MTRSLRGLPGRLGRLAGRAVGALISRRRRRAFVREAFFRLAALVTPTLETRSGGLRFFVSTADRGVGMTLFMGLDPELGTLRRVEALLAERGLPLDGTDLVDVGANIGTTTVHALANLGMRRSTCFEPLERNVELLRLNLRANGLDDRAQVVPVALSDAEGEASLEVAPGNPSDARVRTGEGGRSELGEGSWEVVSVKLRTFDSQVEAGLVDPRELGLVWIDAQGHEGHVLRGARRLLEAGVPVVTEFWPYGLDRAGGTELFASEVARGFGAVVDLDAAETRRGGPELLGELADVYRGLSHTDLLLLP